MAFKMAAPAVEGYCAETHEPGRERAIMSDANNNSAEFYLTLAKYVLYQDE